jgi:hypothetical protein
LNKKYLVGSLLIGYLHKIISRNMYHQIRSVLTIYHFRLPCWEACHRMCAKICTLINYNIIKRESVFGNPIFSL